MDRGWPSPTDASSATSSSRPSRGKRSPSTDNGSQTRSFCYVDDLVDGLIRMMNSEKDFAGPVNLGTPAEFTILELAENADPDDRLRLPDRLYATPPG